MEVIYLCISFMNAPTFCEPVGNEIRCERVMHRWVLEEIAYQRRNFQATHLFSLAACVPQSQMIHVKR